MNNKKLSLSKKTVKNLGVRSGLNTGALADTAGCPFGSFASNIAQTGRCLTNTCICTVVTGFCNKEGGTP